MELIVSFLQWVGLISLMVGAFVLGCVLTARQLRDVENEINDSSFNKHFRVYLSIKFFKRPEK